MNLRMNPILSLFVCVITLSLAACGGSGGSANNRALIAVDLENAQRVFLSRNLKLNVP